MIKLNLDVGLPGHSDAVDSVGARTLMQCAAWQRTMTQLARAIIRVVSAHTIKARLTDLPECKYCGHREEGIEAVHVHIVMEHGDDVAEEAAAMIDRGLI